MDDADDQADDRADDQADDQPNDQADDQPDDQADDQPDGPADDQPDGPAEESDGYGSDLAEVEQVWDDSAGGPSGTGSADEPEPAVATWEPTGHSGVDAVLASLDGLPGQSVHEHVAAFEEAHAALRRALDEADPAPDAAPAVSQ